MTEQKISVASRIAKRSLLLLFSQATTFLLSFFAQRVILSTLTKEQNGFLFSERRFVDLIVLIAVDLGMNGVIIRRMVQNPERASTVLSSSIALRMMLWMVATAVCVLYAEAYGYSTLDVLMWSCFLMLSSRIGLLRYSLEMPWRRHLKFVLVSALSILDMTLFLGCVYAFRSQLDSHSIIFFSAVSALPGFIILLLAERGQTVRPGAISFAEMKALAIESLPLMASIVLLNIHDKIDALFLSWFSSQSEVGTFGAVYVTLSPLYTVIPVTIAMTLTPVIARYAQENWNECQKFATTGVRFLMVVAIALSTVAASLVTVLVQFVSNTRYLDSTHYFFTFLWITIPVFFLVITQEINIALSNQKANLLITGMLCGITIVLGLILIPMYQGYGAVVTKVATVSTTFLCSVPILYKALRLKTDFYLLFAIVATTAVGIGVSMWVPKVTGVWIGAIVSSAVVIGLMFALKMIRGSDVSMILRVLRTRNA